EWQNVVIFQDWRSQKLILGHEMIQAVLGLVVETDSGTDILIELTGSAGGFNPSESLSPRGPSGNGVVLAAPSSKTMEGNLVSMGCTVSEETEWDCSESSVGLGVVLP
ncbi:hypothetical protein Tco_1425396, partial [Tanacetum coccineum]